MINKNNELAKTFEKVTGQKFETFYHKYRPKLVWYLTRYTKDQEKAEDFADDAFTQALLKIGNYNKEKSQIHTWIYKIAENLVKKDFKDRKRMSVFSLDKDNGDNLNLINIIPSKESHADVDQILSKKAEIVKQTIMSLPEKYRRVMIMRELENRPYLEIAEMCTKEYPIRVEKNSIEMPDPFDFLDITIQNDGKEDCYVNFQYNENKKIHLKVLPNETFNLHKNDIDKLIEQKNNNDNKKVNVSRIDAYLIVSMIKHETGMSFNDMTKLLLNNNLQNYVLSYSANIRRCSLPEYPSYPSDVKKFFFDEKTSHYKPLKEYVNGHKDEIINIINSLMENDIPTNFKVKLSEIVENLNGKNGVSDIYLNDDVDIDEIRSNVVGSIRIDTTDKINGVYRTTTNLSTIKSQISKGRQLIQTMVKKKFKELEENGLE